MGMYTKLKVEIELDHSKRDFRKVVDVLCYMLYTSKYDDGAPPESARYFNHPLFETSRWSWMFRSSSCYFDGHEPSYLKDHTLHVDFDMKNYDNEIQKFLDWIRPYSSSVGDVGIYQYEEDEQETRVVFTENGKVRFDNPMHKDNESGKVTIKFWDVERGEYVPTDFSTTDFYLVDEYGEVAILKETVELSTWRTDDIIKPRTYLEYVNGIVAHYYKDGIRIDDEEDCLPEKPVGPSLVMSMR